MRRFCCLIGIALGLALGGSGAAFADDQVHIGPPPAWVEPLDVPDAAVQQGGAVQALLRDFQVRLSEDGSSISYGVNAYRVLNAQGLTYLGTLTTTWDPELQDMTINAAKIIRGDQTIDLLADGVAFKSLQRETELSSATLNGNLTAIKEITDLRVGDILVFATTVTTRRSVAGAQPEDGFGLTSLPFERTHYTVTWPKSLDVKWKSTEGIEGAHLEAEGDLMRLTYDATDASTPDLPDDVPDRIRLLGSIEVSGFQSWNQISALLAPYFQSAAELEPDSPLLGEIDQIREGYNTDEERAAAALRLVQQHVRYLALTLGEGGLIPAKADDTWRNRYGDCKAKTVLLTAILHKLGIDAEPVVVAAEGGLAMPDHLPRIGAFNHVIVRAKINGKTYWLDGTGTADQDIENATAPFGYALPLEVAGADLEEIPVVQSKEPLMLTTIHLDARGGPGRSAKASVREVSRGAEAVSMMTLMNDVEASKLEDYIKSYFEKSYDWLTVDSVTYGYDPKLKAFVMEGQGEGQLDWEDIDFGRGARGRRTNLGLTIPYDAPDRDKDDQKYPVSLTYPYYEAHEIIVDLPNDGRDYRLVGNEIDRTVGNVELKRSGGINDGRAVIRMSARTLGPEVSWATAKADADKVVADGDDDSIILFTGNATSLALLDADDSNESAINQAVDLADQGDVDGAMDILNKAIRSNDTPRLRLVRAALRATQSDYKAGLTDVRQALKGEPNNARARELEVTLLWGLNRFDEAAESASNLTVADNPAEGPWYLALSYVGAKRYPKAADAMQQAFDAGNGNPDLDMSLLDAALKDMSEAERQALGDEMTRHPSNPLARLVKAATMTNLALELPQLDEAIRQAPNYLDARHARVYAHIGLKHYDAAEEDLDWLIENAADSQTYTLHAALLAERGDVDGAVADYQSAIQISPDDAQLYNDLCWMRATHDLQLDEALENCNEAVRLEPDNGAYYDSRGLVNLQNDRPAYAIADYDVALSDQDFAESYYGRGIAKIRMGDKEGGQADIARALRINPDIAGEFKDYGVEP